MSGAAFILIITLLIAGLFSAAFVLIALYDRRYVSARWFALSYAAGMGYAVLEFVLPAFQDPQLGVFLGHATFLVTLVFLNVGLARRYDVVPPRTLMMATFGVSLLGSALVHTVPQEPFVRMFVYQTPFFAMQAIGAWIVLRARNRGAVDTVVAGLLALSALHFLAKPLLATLTGGAGVNPQDYLLTTYAMISQSMGVILAVATGLILLTLVATDIVQDITARSETDILSGLLNRRGFEERLGDIVRQRARSGLPVSLVICDLDNFKRVNDGWGHAVGDQLIALFAATLREHAASHHVLGRIGGEEFAAVLPGANLPAARLFAESVRVAFSDARLTGMPSGQHFTASFGVAEMSTGERPAALLARADAALYEAKRAGRDRVCVSRIHHIIEDGRVKAVK